MPRRFRMPVSGSWSARNRSRSFAVLRSVTSCSEPSTTSPARVACTTYHRTSPCAASRCTSNSRAGSLVTASTDFQSCAGKISDHEWRADPSRRRPTIVLNAGLVWSSVPFSSAVNRPMGIALYVDSSLLDARTDSASAATLRSRSSRNWAAMASAASRLDASAAVTLLTAPMKTFTPNAAASTSYRPDMSVRASDAPYHIATGLRAVRRMRNSRKAVTDTPNATRAHMIGRNTAKGATKAATSNAIPDHWTGTSIQRSLSRFRSEPNRRPNSAIVSRQ